jgi:hypothetical protein
VAQGPAEAVELEQIAALPAGDVERLSAGKCRRNGTSPAV